MIDELARAQQRIALDIFPFLFLLFLLLTFNQRCWHWRWRWRWWCFDVKVPSHFPKQQLHRAYGTLLSGITSGTPNLAW